jgi:hypothetical protein
MADDVGTSTERTKDPMRTLLIALTTVAAVTVAGCGGDGETTDQDAAAASPSATESPRETASETPSETPDAPPSESPSHEVQLHDEGMTQEIRIRGDQVMPSAKRVDLGTGERLLVTVRSDRAGELHVHSSPEQELAFSKGTSVVDIVVETPGIVEVEEHESGAVILRLYVS